ncbi:amidohydrolase [Streptomyces sp. R21]|uniref:Amidohydrolase n=1 Tax=Streptomyces sp. R21 TaxID=3238627 RepID=A0AB39P3T2_9ACTN
MGAAVTVDAHHHVWDLSVRDQDWITGPELRPLRRNFAVTDLEPEARAAGVDRTVLVQTVTVAEETPEFLALVLDDLRPYADTVLDAFGPDRLMFGSDWPVCTLAASYAQVIDTAHELIRELDATGCEAVLTGTATRVYQL